MRNDDDKSDDNNREPSPWYERDRGPEYPGGGFILALLFVVFVLVAILVGVART